MKHSLTLQVASTGMELSIPQLAAWAAAILEAAAIAVIVSISLQCVGAGIRDLSKGHTFESVVSDTRRRLGKGILLGLEVLIGADLIHTVAVELTLESVAVLGIVVLIRTFLSFALETELNGRWPWQQSDKHS